MSAISSPSGDPTPIPQLEQVASDAPVETVEGMVESEPGEKDDSWQWLEPQAEAQTRPVAGGRALLGGALVLLAAAWIAYSAWSAGRALATQPLESPAFAQWVAVATGPLALLGLIWLMFGRTRRREAEKFTHSVVAMRGEARALEVTLGALSQRIASSHAALGQMSGELADLGEATATRLGAVTGDLNASAVTLHERGSALDRSAERARQDLQALLDDLPRADALASGLAEHLREAGTAAGEQASQFDHQVGLIGTRTRETHAAIDEAATRMVAHLTHIESAGAAAAARVGEVSSAGRHEVDALMARSAEALDQIRGGIDVQSAAVTALVEQADAAIGRSGIAASEALAARLDGAGSALDTLTARIAEQERSSQRLVADLDLGLDALDQKFAALAEGGEQRSQHILVSVARLRDEIDALGQSAGAHDGVLLGLADRTATLRGGVESLAALVADQLRPALGEAEAGQQRLTVAAVEVQPLIAAMRDATIESARQLDHSRAQVEDQHDRLAALLTAVDTGVDGAQRRLAELGSAISQASSDAALLSRETGPALVDALVQVREAAAHAGARAREAIVSAIPESAAELGEASRVAIDRAIREAVEDKLAAIDTVAAQAIEAARSASDRLTAQMLTIGQTASALEEHIERSRLAQKKDDGEEFARRVSLLIDSMNSAAIDVQKILSDEVDERAWVAYLKGNRGIFTRRAVRLLGRSEERALAGHYGRDHEFQDSANRYVADFEAMLRRVLAERDSGMIAVTLMSSDMGKLYAALAPLAERRR